MQLFSTTRSKAIPIFFVTKNDLKSWMSGQSEKTKRWLNLSKFSGAQGEICLVPEINGNLAKVVVGGSSPIEVWDAGSLAMKLPKGKYVFSNLGKQSDLDKAILGWALGSYSFEKYKKREPIQTKLYIPPKHDRRKIMETVSATFLVRDLINTPTEDMGPSDLEKASRALAGRHNAKIKVIKGDKLLSANFPAIHAIGRSSEDLPRIIDINWGNQKKPEVVLVGKGVCFDTGGLNIKPASGMKLMKKDMGGAAHVLGLASMIMGLKAPIKLRVLIPVVENSISGNSIRPLDVIKSRSGKTIEIGHTDAEGRVILADALTEAVSRKPSLVIDFATLTGAARVALGTEVPALFSNNDRLAECIVGSGKTQQDPLWRLPLWPDYRRHILGKVGDLTNSPETGFGGAITAALFLQEFVGTQIPWAHIDLMAWNTNNRIGRPEGGEAMGMRAIYQAILDWV